MTYVREVELPLILTGLTSNPMFSTDVIVGANGQEVRNANWQDARWKFNAAAGIKNRSDVFSVYSFFLTVYGQETAFLLKDHNDFAIPHSGSTPQAIGTGDGTNRTFQIYKRYSDGAGNYFDRTISCPSGTAGDLKVYVNGSLKTLTTHYTFSTTTGIITFTVGNAPPAGQLVTITLSKFFVPVRFAQDEFPMDMLLFVVTSGDPYTLSDLPEIPLIEVRPS